MAKNKAKIPDPAKYSVKCDKSPSGKHVPQTYEKKVDDKHVKYKLCRHCNCTLK